ncbi:DUF4253 domain-containing protein [Micromonospora echinaurantiaca]|uniref:DUF4253 domain-containing protein n=1 Tax=Micromonospora echinaurantiaca TaxID=47857 RepID=UPI0037B3D69D
MNHIDDARRLLEAVGIHDPHLRDVGGVPAFHAEPAQLLPLWRRLRELAPAVGRWPVILGPRPDGLRLIGDDERDDAIAAGLGMDVAARLGELREELLAWEEGDDEDEIEYPPRGPADGLAPHDEDGFVLAAEPGWMGLVPAAAGHLVPAVLGLWAGGNYAMEPADHVAVLRHWHDRYGAELVAVSDDIIELRVLRPPADPATVLAVAEEQYWYCQDIVDQGVETIDALAAVQVPARRWFFWWD